MSTTLAPGSYFGKLIDAGLESVGKNSTPAFGMLFAITHVAENGAWAAITEVRRNIQLFMTDAAREYALADLRKLGFDGNFDSPKFDTDVHEGLEISLWHEVYEGKTQEKLKIARLKQTHERKPVADDVKRTLQALYKGSAPKPVVPAPAPSPRVPAPSPADDTGRPPF